MASKYRVAIIGTGRMGGLIEDEIPLGDPNKPYGHFSAYEYIEETEVIAVANRSAERMQRFTERFGVTNTYLDYREMIDVEQPDIVSVTTPSFARAEPLIYAAEHGVRAIYSEKGLCASLEEADRVKAAIKSNNTIFNWGAMRRHNVGFRALAEAIAGGEIGEPQIVLMYNYTDLIKHHPHTLDTVSMLIGDPMPVWVSGRMIADGGPSHLLDTIPTYLDPNPRRPTPEFDAEHNRFLPSKGFEIGDPYVDSFQVGYEGGIVGYFIPHHDHWDVEVRGSEGRAYALDNGNAFGIRRSPKATRLGSAASGVESYATERVIYTRGEPPTVNTIRDLIHSLKTGEPTRGNIDVTMQSVEAQFAIAHSHLAGGTRINIPVEDRSLYIPGG